MVLFYDARIAVRFLLDAIGGFWDRDGCRAGEIFGYKLAVRAKRSGCIH